MAYNDIVILCFRTTNPDVLIVDGASKTKCDTCAHEVWIAPTSRQMRHQTKARIVCESCGHQELRPKPGEVTEFAPISKEQIQEIKDTLENRKHRN